VTGKWWTAKKGPPPVFNEIRKHPDEAKRVKEAYRLFLAGTDLRAIAKKWNDAGVKTPRGNAWSGTRVRELLLLARNAGLREFRGEVVGKGTWPAIVTEETWRAAHSTLTAPGRRNGPFRGRKYLLSGIVLCGSCDAAMTSHISSRGKRQYACQHCRKVSRDGEKVDKMITAAVVKRLSRPDAVELLLSDDDKVDFDTLREQRRVLEDRLAQLGSDFASAPPAFTQAALADIKGKLDAINGQLEDSGKVDIYEGVIGAKDVRKAFDGLDLGRQRTIVHALMAPRVLPVGKGAGRVFDPGSVEPGWKDESRKPRAAKISEQSLG
jgi:hypothetical protein